MEDTITRPDINLETLPDQGLLSTIWTCETVLLRWDTQLLGTAAHIEEFWEDAMDEASRRGLDWS